MQIFFEEPLSKKLIKTHQIVLCLLIGYLETNEISTFKMYKIQSNLNNVISNIHRNYLVFVEFICNNLTEEQYDVANDWAGKLKRVLKTRAIMKSHYTYNNSELLQTNNSISIKLVKDLLRQSKRHNEYTQEANFILKNMEMMEITTVRDIVIAAVNKSKMSSGDTSTTSVKSHHLKKSKTGKNLFNQTLEHDTYTSKGQNQGVKRVKNNNLIKPMYKEMLDSSVNKDMISTNDFKRELEYINRTKSAVSSKKVPSTYDSPEVSPKKVKKMSKKKIEKHEKISLKTTHLEQIISKYKRHTDPVDGTNSEISSQSHAEHHFQGQVQEIEEHNYDSEAPMPSAPVPIATDSWSFKLEAKLVDKPANTDRVLQSQKEISMDSIMRESPYSNSKKAEGTKELHNYESLDKFIESKANEFISSTDQSKATKSIKYKSPKAARANKTGISTPKKRVHAYRTQNHTLSDTKSDDSKKKFQINRQPDAIQRLMQTEKKREKHSLSYSHGHILDKK